MLETLKNTDSDNLALCKVTTCHDAKCQSGTTNTIDYTKNTSKEYVKCIMVQNSKSVCTNDYSYQIVVKQIKRICRDLQVDYELPLKVILYYCSQYEEYLHKHHPKMQNKHYQRVIENIVYNDCDFELDDYEEMIDKHFITDYGQDIDYNMLHFFTDGIIENRSFETLQ